MSAKEHAHASRRGDEDDDRKHPGPDTDGVPAEEYQDGSAPALPDLDSGPVEPSAWLALQQTIGNRAVGGLVEQRRAGQPLPPKTRHEMEASFGRDFGQVQIHSGPDVDQAAEALDAAAFTVAEDIYVRSDLPGVEDPFGRAVMGEELAHVAQGVGRGGVSRVTAPGETAEGQARQAGAAAASGRHAEVSAAPEVAGAVARFGLSETLIKGGGSNFSEEFIQAVGATAAEAMPKTELSDEEKDRLKAGALYPLIALRAELGEKVQAAKDGKPSAQQLQPIYDNADSIGPFIYSFAGPTATQASIEQAVRDTGAGRRSVSAAIDPQRTLLATADLMATTAAEIDGLASVPAAAPAAGTSPPELATTDSLTPAEAAQLQLGAANPLTFVSEQLKSPEHDLETIIDRLANVPGVLRSFSKPASLVPQLRRMALAIDIQVTTLIAIHRGAKAAIEQAMVFWSSAILALQGLTAKPAGGAPKPAEPPAPSGGDDEDKKKPT